MGADEPTVYVVDEEASTREAVRNLVHSMHLKCEAFDSAQAFLDGGDGYLPGCLVLDAKLPGIGGLQFQRYLAQSGVHLPVIFLSTQAGVAIAVRAMRAGAVHFLEKPFREHELWEAIWEGVLLSQQQWEAAVQKNEMEELLAKLSDKDKQMLGMIAAGETNRAVASALGVSLRTIDVRRRSLMDKLRVESRTELLRLAFALVDRTDHPEPPTAPHYLRTLPSFSQGET